jgi:Type IV pili methyl-accepting chemotaxis transducer N-term
MKQVGVKIISIHVIWIWLLTLMLSSSVFAQVAKPTSKAAQKADAGALLNMASRQPMLAERITKSFLMMTRNVLTFRSRNHLEESLAEFESNLVALIAAAPTNEIRENYELLDQLFEELKTIKSKPVNKQSAAELAEQNEELVWIAQKGANLLQAHTKSARNDLIATAGEVRVLTQRLAKLYLFRTSGIRSTVVANDLKKAEENYRVAIEKLVRAPQNTEQIKQELVLAETQWLFLRGAIERLNADQTSTIQLEHVSKTCDNILSVMEKIAGLYGQIKA